MQRVITKKLLTSVLSLLLTITMFSSVAAAKPTGGGGGSGGKPSGKNTAPAISTVGATPILTEDSVTTGTVHLSAVDSQNHTFTWSILSTSFGTAVLSGQITTTSGTGSIDVIYTAGTNQNGTANITVQAKDSLGAASRYTISIVVNPVNDAPINTLQPAVSGTLSAGQTATAIDGTWSDIETPAASLVYSYQWKLADDQNGANASIISGAVSKTYSIGSGFSGKYLCVVVTAADTGDGTSAPLSTSAASAWVIISQPAEAQFYVALGDSIAAGTDNSNILGNSYKYTNTFSNSLAAIFTGTAYSYVNDAMPGDTTDDLLSKLLGNSSIRSDVSRATIITISIGGNNVLDSASPQGYSKINDAAALAGIDNFKADLPAIIDAINSLHSGSHLPQIYVMDMYNIFHPWELGKVEYSNGAIEEVFMNEFVYDRYLSQLQAAIDISALAYTNVYHVNTYDAFNQYANRFTITNTSALKQADAFISAENPNGYYFYSPYIERTAVYSDVLTRFDIYPFYPILFDYFNLDKYRDPHPEQTGHNVLSEAHLLKFKAVNNLQ